MLNIQENIPLARYTTFKIGGPARFFCEVRNEEELEEAVRYAKDNNLSAFIMAGGSNLLISDDGFDGLVIKIASQSSGKIPPVKMRLENGFYFLECWAGESLANIAKLAQDSSLTGLEWAAGIPGTIGGAVRGNAGAFGSCIENIVENVRVLDLSESVIIIEGENQKSNIKNQNYKSKFKILNNAECKFSYRESTFKQRDNLVINSVVLRLKKGNKNEIEETMGNIIKKRMEKQPRGLASPGSFFANPVVKDEELRTRFEHDTSVKCQGDKIPAGWLVAEAGFLGKKIGGAKVSEEHGNFVVNTGNATAQDVIMLISLIKQKIRSEFGVQLKEEVQYLGL